MQRLVEHSVRNNQVEVGIVMCEPGSPAKRYGGVHTGGEYNIQNDTRLCTSTCRAAPQFPPNPLDAAPAVGCTRARSCRGPAAGPPRSSVVVVVAAPAVPAHRDRPGHCRLPRGGPASAATAKRRLKSAAEATMATRTSSLPSEATITETTWRPSYLTPRLALQCRLVS